MFKRSRETNGFYKFGRIRLSESLPGLLAPVPLILRYRSGPMIPYQKAFVSKNANKTSVPPAKHRPFVVE